MFNEQQLKLIRDTIVEKLSRNESLDATTRSTFGTILAQVKEQLQVLEDAAKRENRFREDWNIQVDEMLEQEAEDIRLNK
jgi:hypothetical protein